MGHREVSSLEDIKEIGGIELTFPEDCIEKDIPEAFDILIEKIDEMVRRVNELSKRGGI